MTRRFILVGCVKGKQPGRWPAKELYRSTLFEGRRLYAERARCSWYILSAKYGLVAPDSLLDWYEATLKEMSAVRRRQWSEGVLAQIDHDIGDVSGSVVEVHAGKEYRSFGLTAGLIQRGAEVAIPTEHLGLGKQLAWYRTVKE